LPPPLPPPPPSPPPSPPPPPPPSPPGLRMCEDNCQAVTSTGVRVLHRNGACEDGLEGSQSAQCMHGTDCTDCGPRILYPPPPPQGRRMSRIEDPASSDK
jgi:DNA-directed RNA polymerase subunit RPC12/RpoP